MIPNNTSNTATLVDTMGGERIQVGVDQKNIAFVMDLLTNIYSNNVLAVIREYSTNAQDANRAAGSDAPIRVTLPTVLHNYFTVSDSGTGMSADDIRNIYSLYTASTKRDRREDNGFMGIGAKAGLAYSSTFTIRSVKDGMLIQVVASKVTGGGVEMRIASNVETDEPNGTTITVPVPAYDTDNFRYYARIFFQHWKPGEALLDGEEPSRISSWEKISDRVFYDAESPNDVIVMGGVAYPVNLRAIRPMNGGRYVCYVGLTDDSVVITPNREALIQEGRTVKVIDSLVNEINDAVTKSINDAINAVSNKIEARQLRDEMRTRYGSQINNITSYNDEDIPEYIVVENPTAVIQVEWRDWKQENLSYRPMYVYGRRNSIEKATEFIVVNAPSGELNPRQKGMIGRYVRDTDALDNLIGRGLTLTLIDGEVDDPRIKNLDWFEFDRIIDWNDIIRKAPKPGGTGGKPKPLDCVYLSTLGGLEYGKVEKSNLVKGKVIFAGWAHRYRPSKEDIKKVLDEFPDHTIVYLPEHRWNTFKKSFDAIMFVEAKRRAIESVKGKITAEYVRARSLANTTHSSFFRDVDYELFDDPMVKEIVEAFKTPKDLEWESVGYESDTSVDYDYFARTYPLLNHMYSYTLRSEGAEALAEYMNMVYAKKNNNKGDN